MGGAAGARFNLVAPQAPPLHKKRVQALHFVVAAGQQQQLAVAAQRPGLQRLGYGALAQGPVGEIGIAKNQLAKARGRCGGMGNGVAHGLLKSGPPLQGALRQIRQAGRGFRRGWMWQASVGHGGGH